MYWSENFLNMHWQLGCVKNLFLRFTQAITPERDKRVSERRVL